MIAEELQNRNRSDIAESYEGQSPTNIHANRNENTDSNAPTLNNVSSSKTNLIHDQGAAAPPADQGGDGGGIEN